MTRTFGLLLCAFFAMSAGANASPTGLLRQGVFFERIKAPVRVVVMEEDDTPYEGTLRTSYGGRFLCLGGCAVLLAAINTIAPNPIPANVVLPLGAYIGGLAYLSILRDQGYPTLKLPKDAPTGGEIVMSYGNAQVKAPLLRLLRGAPAVVGDDGDERLASLVELRLRGAVVASLMSGPLFRVDEAEVVLHDGYEMHAIDVTQLRFAESCAQKLLRWARMLW